MSTPPSGTPPMNTNATTGGAALSPAAFGGKEQAGGRRHRGASVKTLKRVLKKNGLKTTGKKATLTRRVKKAHLKIHGGNVDDTMTGTGELDKEMGGRRKKSRKGLFGKLF